MKKNDIQLAREWLKKAGDDLLSAQVILNEGGYLGTTCFLSQQIVEKCLKGFLVAHGAKPDKIHDLIKLLNDCLRFDRSLMDIQDECVMLNDYYIEARYPLDVPVDYKKPETRSALKAAEVIIQRISNKLNQ